MDNVLSMTGLALRAGKLEVGEDAAGEACQYMRCRLLLLARDAGEAAQRRAAFFAEEGGCLLLELPYEKEALGPALGRKNCAMAAVTDLGLASAIVEKLAAADPERYGEALERLRLKARRAAQRREKKQKQRAAGRGGKRPPPPYQRRGGKRGK